MLCYRPCAHRVSQAEIHTENFAARRPEQDPCGFATSETPVKRNVKWGETKPLSGETNSSVFERLRFIAFPGVFIGARLLKWPFVSHFTAIGRKCETKSGVIKRT